MTLFTLIFIMKHIINASTSFMGILHMSPSKNVPLHGLIVFLQILMPFFFFPDEAKHIHLHRNFLVILFCIFIRTLQHRGGTEFLEGIIPTSSRNLIALHFQ